MNCVFRHKIAAAQKNYRSFLNGNVDGCGHSPDCLFCYTQ